MATTWSPLSYLVSFLSRVVPRPKRRASLPDIGQVSFFNGSLTSTLAVELPNNASHHLESTVGAAHHAVICISPLHQRTVPLHCTMHRTHRITDLAMRVALFASFAASATTTTKPSTATRIHIGSCSDTEEFQPMWSRLRRRRGDAFFWGGDIVYGDRFSPEVERLPATTASAARGA